MILITLRNFTALENEEGLMYQSTVDSSFTSLLKDVNHTTLTLSLLS